MVFLSNQIESKHFSTRSANVLRREKIETNEALIELALSGTVGRLEKVGDCTQKELETAAAKLTEKITLHREEVMLGEITAFFPDAAGVSALYAEFAELQKKMAEEIPSEFESLSVRARNALENVGIFENEQLRNITEEQLYAIPNLGKKSVEEILSYRFAYLRGEIAHMSEKTEAMLSSVSVGFLLKDEKPKMTRLTTDELHKMMQNLKNGTQTLAEYAQQAEEDTAVPDVFFVEDRRSGLYAKAETEANLCCMLGVWHAAYSLGHLLWQTSCGMEGVLEEEALMQAAKQKILVHYEENSGYSEAQIFEFLPDEYPEALKKRLLDELQQEKLENIDGLYRKKRPALDEYLAQAKEGRDKDIFIRRLNGETLEEIGESLSLTRERVRQLCAKYVKDLQVYEDHYMSFFTCYALEKDDYALFFGDGRIGMYLEMKYDKGSRALDDALEDETLSVRLRKQAERVVYRNYIYDNGVMVKKYRPDLVHHVIQWYCQEETTIEEYLERYHQFLEKYGLTDEKKYGINDKSFANKIALNEDTVYHFNKKFRYYPISTTDFSDLIDGLNFARYENVEYSTLYFFRMYPDLMRQYDIHDEYELHNILKKVLGEGNVHLIHFGKMPMIEFGQANRDSQVFDLMMDMAPVDALTLGQAYEEKYGMQAQTVMGTGFRCIRDYFYKGMYRIDDEAMPAAAVEAMSAVLDEEFYTFAKLRQIYLRQNPAGKPSQINPYSVRQLGFNAYDDYAIASRYDSALAFYKHFFLDRGDIVDARQIPAEMKNRTYATMLYEVRHEFEAVEFLPEQYITMNKLELSGITKQMLLDYCRDVDEFVGDEPFFTMKSLRKMGFEHPLDEMGFDDWFYMSLLSQEGTRFAVQRTGNIKFATRSRQELSRIKIISYVISRCGSMKPDELSQRMEERYGLCISRDKIIELVKNSSMYYDRIMDTIYEDYDAYFEEV